MKGRAKVRISWRAVVELFCVATCTVLFLFTAMSIATVVLDGRTAGTRDYIEYWASGQQLAHHRNPYDAAALLNLERAQGLPAPISAMVMGNAPPALLLTYPLGFMGARTGECIWMLLLLVSLIAAVRLISAALGSNSQKVSILGYSFAPAIMCIPSGQMALFVLLGLALFLRFYQTRPIMAGAALWLCLLKPQIFVPFGLVMGFWILRNRQIRVLGGAFAAIGASIALIWVLDPRCWDEYLTMMGLMRYDRLIIPCLSVVLRQSVPSLPFIQYVPVVCGSVWALAFFWRHRTCWDWMEHGSVVLLVSLLVAPYTWFVDQSVALPALLRGAAVTRSRMMVAGLAFVTAAIELGVATKHDLLHSGLYLWTTPFYLIWYLIATRSRFAAAGSENSARTAVSEPAHSSQQAPV